jgi:hypothetical protein
MSHYLDKLELSRSRSFGVHIRDPILSSIGTVARKEDV